MKEITLKQIKAIIDNIEDNYFVEPNNENLGRYYMSAKDGFQMLLKELKKSTKTKK